MKRAELERLAFDRIVDALLDDVDAVRGALAARRPLSDASVHEVRKALKHARACVRLMRTFLGKRGYARCNASLRDAARPLSAARDASVLIATLDSLIAPGASDELRRFRLELARERKGLRRALAPSKTSLAAVRACLHKLDAETGRSNADRSKLRLEAALRRVYAHGRRALALLEREASDERLHELRKQAKYLWNALALLEHDGKKRLRRSIAQAHALADELGDDHDLASLHDKAHAGCALGAQALRVLDRKLAKRRKRLLRRALRRAKTLYAKPGRAFVARVMKELSRAR